MVYNCHSLFFSQGYKVNQCNTNSQKNPVSETNFNSKMNMIIITLMVKRLPLVAKMSDQS